MRAQPIAAVYQWSAVAAGAAVLLAAGYHAAQAPLDPRFLVLAPLTVAVGSRITIRIPGGKGNISVSDTFVFLAILLFGLDLAVLLAAAEAFFSSRRFCRKRVTILFNAAVMACSTLVTVWAVRLVAGGEAVALREGYTANYIVGVCVMALVQYVVNSCAVALAYSLLKAEPFWPTWRKHFLWTSISYFAGASAAGVVARLIDGAGFYAVLAAAPIIVIVYFTYTTYLKNVEASAAQAEQAGRHVVALRESEARFRSVFDHAAGMGLADEDGRWIKVNRSLCEMLGYTERDLLARSFQTITHPDDLDTVLAQTAKLLAGEVTTFQTELRYTHRRGHPVWVLLSVTLNRGAEGRSANLIFQLQDIGDRKRAEERLVHDAFHDVLTGLPNRALFMDHLKLSVERAKRRGDRLFAVLFLDLDRFKLINDSLGHMVGDRLLVGIARRLETCLRPGDTVARLGGDEFTVLLEDLAGADEATDVAGRLQEKLSRPFGLDGHEVFTTVSIGIALSTTGYDRAEDVLRDADTAMYRAKTLGKARHEVFDKAMHARALNLLQLETDLRRAVERREFHLHYQPIVSLKGGALTGFEALARWQHPERGAVMPDEFIPVAEETGLIAPIGKLVLGDACRQLAVWQERYPQYPPLQVSVNLSGKQFMKPDLIEHVREVLAETGIEPRSLKLEITESIMMENIETAPMMLAQLRALGVELAIDDFGTGYSSLSYLHRFPINTLKIDRSFVGRMDGHNENAEIVRTIVMLARSLEMDVVAEGVETEDQFAQLKTLKCEYGQGFFFSRPVDAAGAERLLSASDAYMVVSAPYDLPPIHVQHDM
ncbi:MAG TPA: EAL domain-containing protein [Pyrinomonadaceae bacterium]|nr:EAL domain-containing protein [Pyrinomonadaceae bacterium]